MGTSGDLFYTRVANHLFCLPGFVKLKAGEGVKMDG